MNLLSEAESREDVKIVKDLKKVQSKKKKFNEDSGGSASFIGGP